MMQWEYSSLPQSLIDTKAIQWNKDKLLTTLLLNRGFSDEKSVNEFINPEISDFRNPFKFEKMASVVDKILAKKKKMKKSLSMEITMLMVSLQQFFWLRYLVK